MFLIHFLIDYIVFVYSHMLTICILTAAYFVISFIRKYKNADKQLMDQMLKNELMYHQREN